jgi:hypothetical protein
MSAPLFSVGEEVVVIGLISTFDARVVGIEWEQNCETVNGPWTGWCYFISPDPDPREISYTERTLRKKHKPSEQSFTQLLDTLKGRVVA